MDESMFHYNQPHTYCCSQLKYTTNINYKEIISLHDFIWYFINIVKWPKIYIINLKTFILNIFQQPWMFTYFSKKSCLSKHKKITPDSKLKPMMTHYLSYSNKF